MPPKRRYRPPRSEEEEKEILDECIPKSTGSATKWAYKVFSQWQSERENKNPCAEHCSFPVDLHKIQTLETSIVDMSVESLNFWLTKFFEEIVKENGER